MSVSLTKCRNFCVLGNVIAFKRLKYKILKQFITCSQQRLNFKAQCNKINKVINKGTFIYMFSCITYSYYKLNQICLNMLTVNSGITRN